MKVGRYLLLIVLSGIVGGIIGSVVSIFKYTNIFSEIKIVDSNLLFISFIASILNVILIFILYKVQRDAIKFKKKANYIIEDEKADEFDRKANVKNIHSTLIFHIQVLICFINMFIVVLANNHENTQIYSMFPIFITIIPSLMVGFFARRFNANYPKQGEAQYSEKVLKTLDEGERHITLVSMFKIYHINLAMILLSIIILGLISLRTGINQSVGLFILIILFIYNAFGYILKVRKFYK